MMKREGDLIMNKTREIGISIPIYKTVTVEEVVTKEELTYINHNITENQITVGTRFFNPSGQMIKEDTVFITGDNYSLLMSDSEVFEDGKELGVIRDADLWYVIDKVRGD
ncbi:MAG: hypothetical protein ACLUQ0_05330 [Enterococcus italicus]|uniref:hypothetical protein n=1 Tax=Enterococcus italicus TaxID=246144 RepID=UPI0039957F75